MHATGLQVQQAQVRLGGFSGFAARFAEAKDFLGPALGEVLNDNTSAATGADHHHAPVTSPGLLLEKAGDFGVKP